MPPPEDYLSALMRSDPRIAFDVLHFGALHAILANDEKNSRREVDVASDLGLSRRFPRRRDDGESHQHHRQPGVHPAESMCCRDDNDPDGEGDGDDDVSDAVLFAPGEVATRQLLGLIRKRRRLRSLADDGSDAASSSVTRSITSSDLPIVPDVAHRVMLAVEPGTSETLHFHSPDIHPVVMARAPQARGAKAVHQLIHGTAPMEPKEEIAAPEVKDRGSSPEVKPARGTRPRVSNVARMNAISETLGPRLVHVLHTAGIHRQVWRTRRGDDREDDLEDDVEEAEEASGAPL